MTATSPLTEGLYQDYLASLLKSDRVRCRQIVTDLLKNGTEIEDIYTHFFQRSLYEVGELWETNRLSVAEEHLATAVTEALMSQIYPTLFSRQHTNKSVVISCIANEYHQVGAKMVADILELRGWNSYFLGANSPLDDVLHFIDQKRPNALGLSLAVSFNWSGLERVVERVTGAFPDLPIWVGGQALRWGGAEKLSIDPRVTLFQSLADLTSRISEDTSNDG